MPHQDTSRTSRRRFLQTTAVGGALLLGSGSATATRSEGAGRTHMDVTYATREGGERRTGGDLKLDLYLPDREGPVPLVVYVHGGGWLVNTRKQTLGVERFTERGYAVASIDYRLSYVPDDVTPIIRPDPDNPTPRGVFPDPIVDVKAAIRWLRAHADEYGIDPRRIATWGSSAGSHLAALAGTMDDVEEVEGRLYDVTPTVHPDESGRVQGVVGWYTPTDFLLMDEQAGSLGHFDHEASNSPESLLVGGDINRNALRVRRANPLTYLDVDDPPFLLMHGRQDGTVPYEQSEVLFEKLGDVRVDATFYVLDGLHHAFGFDDLESTPRADQTVRTTGDGHPDRGHLEDPSDWPAAGADAIEQFLDGTIGRGRGDATHDHPQRG
ncbi:MAG: alpha/beta hydrolase fold domain-containing protein [Halarchaeum sp.]